MDQTWQFNGDLDAPTFQPSILTYGTEGAESKAFRCHSYIKDGQIQFLDDCSHELKNQTVPLPDWDDLPWPGGEA